MIDYDVLIDKMIDSYQITELLGKGGMGAVYKAYDHQFHRWVGLKIINPRLLTQPDLIQQFRLEAEAATGLNHYNIAQLFSIGTFQNVPYYTMEYIEGKSLSELFQEKGRLSGMSCMNYLYQICNGLEYCQVNGVIHRDIKPANIMITNDGILKVVDFGLAMVLQEGTRSQEADQILGTPKYISPEAGTTKILDHRSDIYSLGATFYHLMAGEPAFTASSPIELLKKHIGEPLIPLCERNPIVPKVVSDIISKMMEKNPKQRYQNYNDLKEDIKAAKAGGFSQPKSKQVSAQYPARKKASGKKKLPIVPVIISAFLLLIMAIFVMMQQQSVNKSEELSDTKADDDNVIDFGNPGGGRPDNVDREPGTDTEPSSPSPPLIMNPLGPIQKAKKMQTLAQMKQIDTMTMMFLSVNGRLPNTIDEMVEELKVGSFNYRDGWGNDMQIISRGDLKYGVVSAGPDGTWGTRDDIELQNGLIVRGN